MVSQIHSKEQRDGRISTVETFMRESRELRLCRRLSCRRDARTKTKTACILNFTLFRVINFALLSFLINLLFYTLRALSPIMHLICPPKFCISWHCFQFLLGRLKYPGEMKNKGYPKFWRCASGVQNLFSLHFFFRIYLIIFIKSLI